MSDFLHADPQRVGASLTGDQVHVWRLPYARLQGHAPFRALLSAYLGMAPDDVQLARGPHGRPYLAAPQDDFRFNWSHSGECAVMVLSRSLACLGVDYEAVRPRPRALALARRFFRHDEADALAALAPDLQTSAFLRLWTAKEAVLKGLGVGLHYGLDRVPFALNDTAIEALEFDGPVGEASRWQIHSRTDASGYLGLAWRGPARHVACFLPDAELCP